MLVGPIGTDGFFPKKRNPAILMPRGEGFIHPVTLLGFLKIGILQKIQKGTFFVTTKEKIQSVTKGLSCH
jgi:hypothetical protein